MVKYSQRPTLERPRQITTTLFQLVTFTAEAVLNQELGQVGHTREAETDEQALLAGLQHLELPQLVHGGLVDEVQLLLLPLGALRLEVEPDREGQGWDLLEGEIPPEEILVEDDDSAVVHKLHLDLWTDGLQDSGSVPE